MLPVQDVATLRETILQSRMADTTTKTETEGLASGIFGNMLHAAQESIKAADTKAQDAVVGLLSGNGVEVHDAMIATQQAELTFELVLQVRNKAVAAYQQMMQMQF